MDAVALRQGYERAFAWLMYALAALTAAIAGLSYVLLGDASAHEPAAEAEAAPPVGPICADAP
ncbi:hypothetical protein [Lysobacter sp. BMK333-48F3]|uniref:hypothetical protein n=1 Tax=Lysobacter sp. BMK333-48F3 TaxID=2867962 RepID=UPI0031BB6207